MKYSFLSIFLAVTFCVGCSPDMTRFNAEIDKGHERLLNAEHFATESYFGRNDFHAGLILECTNQKAEPYPSLTKHLDAMRLSLNNLQANRAEFYTVSKAKAEALGKQRFKKNLPEKEYSDLNSSLEAHYLQALEIDSLFKNDLTAYDSLISTHEITFMSHALYADSLISRIIVWEDSFEVQGSAIARVNQALKNSGLEKRSEAYMDAYRPISELQKQHKEFESALTGISNAHTRYEAARPTDGYYQGPYLFPRDDVDATEALFDNLDSLMTAFRLQEAKCKLP